MVFCMLRSFCFVLALLLFSPVAFSQSNELRGRVVSVADGDTVTVLDNSNTQYKIRFNGIDAPESKQDFGQVSKRHLSDLVFGKDVTVRWSKKDKYGRIVGTVFVGGTNVNLEQLRAGLAWYYRQYASDVPQENRQAYERAEADARAAKIGLWQQPNPQPPWEFRHPDQASTNQPTQQTRQQSGKIIGNKNSQIYHLSNCPDYSKSAEKNRVYFESEAEAQRAGFRKARNCP
jgi:endonuclease YncB( thermonuclease family)